MTAETEEDWAEFPLFAPEGAEIPCETTESDTPAVGALSHMIYDTDTPEEASELLREQGNRSFKLGKRGYKHAIASYTAAIAAAHGGTVAIPALLNRANAHSRLGNHGYALKDAKAALEIDEANVKALYRCAVTTSALGRYDECKNFCDRAIAAGAKGLEDVRRRAVVCVERERVMVACKERDDGRLMGMLAERGIRVGAPLFVGQTQYSQTAPKWEQGWLWPLLVVYVGEMERSDYLEEVEEDASMGDVLDTVLGEAMEWDNAGLYRDPRNVEIRFRQGWTAVEGEKEEEPREWVTLGRKVTLLEVLKDERYVVPLFPVLYAVPRGWTR